MKSFVNLPKKMIIPAALFLILALFAGIIYIKGNEKFPQDMIHVTSQETGTRAPDDWFVEDLLDTEEKLRSEHGDEILDIRVHKGIVIAFFSDGVSAFNPLHQEEMWNLRIPDISTRAALHEASEKILVSYDNSTLLGTTENRFSIDIVTGTISDPMKLDQAGEIPPPSERLSNVTDQFSVAITSDGSESAIEARDIHTNHLAWSIDTASLCTDEVLRQGENFMMETSGNHVLFSMSCAGESSIRSFNAEDGEQEWEQIWSTPPEESPFTRLHPFTPQIVPTSEADPITSALAGNLEGSYGFLNQENGDVETPTHFELPAMRTGDLTLPEPSGESQAPDHLIFGDSSTYQSESLILTLRLLIETGNIDEQTFEEVFVEGRSMEQRFPYSEREWGSEADYMRARLQVVLESIDA